MKHPRRLFAGVAAFVLAVTAGVVAVRLQQGGSAVGSSAAAIKATATPGQLTDTQKATRKTEVDAVLAKRSTAVLKGDLKGFLAIVDPEQPQLVARQRMLFTNLRKFQFTALKYFVADERPSKVLIAKYGAETFSTRVMMRYRLSGLDAHRCRPIWATPSCSAAAPGSWSTTARSRRR